MPVNLVLIGTAKGHPVTAAPSSVQTARSTALLVALPFRPVKASTYASGGNRGGARDFASVRVRDPPGRCKRPRLISVCAPTLRRRAAAVNDPRIHHKRERLHTRQVIHIAAQSPSYFPCDAVRAPGRREAGLNAPAE